VTETKTPSVGSEPLDFDHLFAAEDNHFWFRARNRVLRAVVRDLIRPLPDGFRVLEVGCGTGYVLRMLEEECGRGHLVGSDLFEEGMAFARTRVRCPVVKADIHALPFPDPFHLIGMFDVLEHLPDDDRVVRDLAARLTPGGALLVTVPAHMALWSHFDEFSQHYRRYSPASLRAVLERNGLKVEYLTQFMAALYPAMWASRRLGRKKKDAASGRDASLQQLKVGRLTNTLFGGLLAWEPAAVRRRVRVPLGTSLLAIARAPASD
jgi:SAM-dependent methyltransferase